MIIARLRLMIITRIRRDYYEAKTDDYYKDKA